MAEPIHNEPGTNGQESFQSVVIHEPKPEQPATPFNPVEREASPEAEKFDLVIVSNRLPVDLFQQEDGTWIYKPTVGGLATALRQASHGEDADQKRKIIWIGRKRQGEPEGYQTALSDAAQTEPFEYEATEIPDEVYTDYYGKIANEVFWPLFHGMPEKIGFNFDDPTSRQEFEQAWNNYEAANKAFAADAIKKVAPSGRIEVHDYHLLLAAQYMRDTGHEGRIDFFLHIPFPSPEQFAQIPHAAEIARAMFASDVVGFQTEKDRDNFLAYAAEHMPLAMNISSDNQRIVVAENRVAKVGAFPISLDPKEFATIAERQHVQQKAKEIKEKYGDRKIIFSGGRLDYTKGYVESLEAYYNLLKNDPDIRDHVVFVFATPLSRGDIDAYKEYRQATEAGIKKIQDEFGPAVIDHIEQQDQEGMVAHGLAADILLVASIADGQNLVIKEGVVTASTKVGQEKPVMVLSKGAGAAEELTDSILFASSPIDIVELEYALYDALTLPVPERERRQQANMEKINRNTIFTWNERREVAGERP